MLQDSTSAGTSPNVSAPTTRSAAVAGVDSGAGATAHREAVVSGLSAAHCALCGVSIAPTRGRRHCSGRCRASASDQRRIGEALYRQRLRDVYDRLGDADRRRFDAECAAGDPLAVLFASILGLIIDPTREDRKQSLPRERCTSTAAESAP